MPGPAPAGPASPSTGPGASTGTGTSTSTRTGGRPGRDRPAWPVAAAIAAVGLVHALVVAHRYHLGSFDDDASYVLAARAVAAGHGLTSTAAGGYPLVGVYPPGYPALLSPLVRIWPTSALPLRALSLVMFVAIFPLTWRYLGRRGLPGPYRLVVLGLLALNPVLATYATMVMPETTFVVVFLLLLLAVERWQNEPPALMWAGAAVIAGAAGLLWLKEAAVGLVIGVAGWLLLRGVWRKALLALVGPALLIAPLVASRILTGSDLIGSRYSGDFANGFRAFHGGLAARIVHVMPHALWTYIGKALPHALVPTSNGLLPTSGPVGALLSAITWTAAPLLALGFVVCCRRHRDVACVAVPAYLAETLVYPFINERRVVLVLPVIAAWYVLGAAAACAAVRRVAERALKRPAAGIGAVLPVLAGLMALTTLAAQFTKNYLYFEGADSSSPDGSPYMAFLRQAGNHLDMVETDYLWTTTLFTGHRTTNGTYLVGCDPDAVAAAIGRDHAGYLLTAALNGGGSVDGCVLPAAARLPTAVRLYRSSRDLASVFQLVGAGTGHPDLRDATGMASLSAGLRPTVTADEVPQTPGDPAGKYVTVAPIDGRATLTWLWPTPVPLSQLSLGAAGPADTVSVTMEVRGADGVSHVVASAPGAVGPGAATPFFLLTVAQPPTVTSVTVSVAVKGSGPVAFHDFHALGPSG